MGDLQVATRLCDVQKQARAVDQTALRLIVLCALADQTKPRLGLEGALAGLVGPQTGG
jgi:hypothetical protein